MISDVTIQVIVTAVCAATAPTIMAYAALRQGKSNGKKADAIKLKTEVIEKKTDVIEKKADDASTKAESAATNAELSAKGTDNAVKQIGEVHASVKIIDKQTNGHLSHLTSMVESQNTMISTLIEILKPRVPRPGQQDTRQDQPSRDKLDMVANAVAVIAETNTAIASATKEVVETLKHQRGDA